MRSQPTLYLVHTPFEEIKKLYNTAAAAAKSLQSCLTLCNGGN